MAGSCCGGPVKASPQTIVDSAPAQRQSMAATAPDAAAATSAADSCCNESGTCQDATPGPMGVNNSCGGAVSKEATESPVACTDGCCKEPTVAKPAKDECNDGCCGDSIESEPEAQDDCCAPAIVQETKVDSCNQGCCGDAATTTTTEADDCCDQDAPTTAPDSKPNACNDGCCGESVASASVQDDCCDGPGASCTKTAASEKKDIVDPDCCKGKVSPCCDESCLERLALRECDSGSELSDFEWLEKANGSSHPASKQRTTRSKACDDHRRSVREQYAERLQALGCICRALLALGKESCCAPNPPASAQRTKKKSCRRTSRESLVRKSVDGCCPRYPKPASTKKSACGSKKARPVSRDSCAGDDCCAPAKRPASFTSKAAVTTTLESLEAQHEGTEHVALSIAGMTCTGCETKLNRTLANLQGVTNLKTSLVLSRAEFDICLSQVTVDRVIKHLERTTEFKCELISSKGHTMDVVVDGSASDFINGIWPTGVIGISLIENNLVRVAFDPKIVGARDLIEKHWKGYVSLAPVCADPALAAGSKHVRHVGYMTLLSAALTIPVLVLAWAPLPEREVAYGSASLALATIVQVAIAGPFYPKALKALIFSRVIEMDLLIVLSTSAAYIFSVVSFGYLIANKPLATGQFFETSTLLVTLIMVGRYVAALARQKAVESISIRGLQTQNALLVSPDDSTQVTEIDARLLQYGDAFRVLPDSRIPTDGTVLVGSSEVDESMLTGEALPVEKHPKSKVMAGTNNGFGVLTVQLNRLPGDNTITNIASMVDQAKLSKPQMQELADKVASYFVPVVVGLTIITFVTWVAVGMAVQGKSASDALVQSITYAITVLIVSCPCAIGLAVPMVVVIASGIAAERGVIFKSAHAIEIAYKTSHVVLDKTGTLTKGQLTIVSEVSLGETASLELLLGLVNENKHPVSTAISTHLKSQGMIATPVTDVQVIAGKGIQGKAGARVLRAGNARWLCLSEHEAVKPLLSQQCTVFSFAIDGELVAVFGLEDTLRSDAADVVAKLQKKNVTVHIVSGDDDGPVRSVAAKVGIAPSNIRSRASPGDKQVYISDLLLSGGSDKNKKKPVVVFCGDGTNDAVALAQATIGVHMHEGSDVARTAADVVLMRPGLSGLLSMMAASSVSVSRIKFNFGWSFVYNTFAVLLAAGAFVHARIPPEFAGLGELVSVLPVIAAAVLLRWSKM